MRIKKYLFSMFLIAAVVCLASGSFFSQAFAAASLNAGNTTLAAELIPPAGSYTVGSDEGDCSGAGYKPFYVPANYSPGASVSFDNMQVSLINGFFVPGSKVWLCQPNPGTGGGSTQIGSGTVPSAPNNGSVTLYLSGAPTLSPSVSYSLQPGVCNGPPATTTPPSTTPAITPLNNITVPGGTPAGTVVTMTVDNGENLGDTNVFATATVVTVKNQFSATLAGVTSALDFSTSEISFVPSGTALPYTPTLTQSQAALTITSDQSLKEKVCVTSGSGDECERSLANGETFTFRVTGDFAGISKIKWDATPWPTDSYSITLADRAAGFALFPVTQPKHICWSTDSPITPRALELTAMDTPGNPMNVGNRYVELTMAAGSGFPGIASGYSRDLVPSGTTSASLGWTFTLAAKRYYVPMVKTSLNGQTETYIKFQSKNTTLVAQGGNSVTATILAKTGTTYNVNVGPITAGTPLTITGTQLYNAVIAQGGTVDPAAGFAAIFTINTPETDTFRFANICDPANGCRPDEVMVLDGKIQE